MASPPNDGMPTPPGQRRVATTIGCLIVVLILAGLVWFAVTNTETVEDRGFLGTAPSPEAWAVG